jgi:hypothetical protein
MISPLLGQDRRSLLTTAFQALIAQGGIRRRPQLLSLDIVKQTGGLATMRERTLASVIDRHYEILAANSCGRICGPYVISAIIALP